MLSWYYKNKRWEDDDYEENIEIIQEEE